MPHIRAATGLDAENLTTLREIKKEDIAARLEHQAQGGSEWLVIEGEELLGWVQLFWDEERIGAGWAKIEDLWIAAVQRGRGLGTQLIQECEHRARVKGRRMIWLEVNPEHNARAHVLYERLGYRHDGGPAQLDGVYDGFEDWVIRLEKALP